MQFASQKALMALMSCCLGPDIFRYFFWPEIHLKLFSKEQHFIDTPLCLIFSPAPRIWFQITVRAKSLTTKWSKVFYWFYPLNPNETRTCSPSPVMLLAGSSLRHTASPALKASSVQRTELCEDGINVFLMIEFLLNSIQPWRTLMLGLDMRHCAVRLDDWAGRKRFSSEL